jgi:hypothetical protein
VHTLVNMEIIGLQMKLKLVSLRLEAQAQTAVIPPVILTATFLNTERPVDLCLQAQGNQFRRLL